MTDPFVPPAEAFAHIRILVGVVVGLTVTRILTGLARAVRSNHRATAWTQLGWSAFLLLAVAHFWWFEFVLRAIPVWTFERFAFLLVFAALHFFLAALLYPDAATPISDAEFFRDQRQPFYRTLTAILVVDVLDTFLKGLDYLESLGAVYVARDVAPEVSPLIAGLRSCCGPVGTGLQTRSG